jgi:7,8-dihydropterin-6-yl-methyl-4-(beta-D-ribofuranosyl)aminobenzene 5'-phosphate synthase
VNKKVKAYIGGLHYTNPMNGKMEDDEEVDILAKYIQNEGITLYTGHCTGQKIIEKLKEKLDEKVIQIHTGYIFNI